MGYPGSYVKLELSRSVIENVYVSLSPSSRDVAPPVNATAGGSSTHVTVTATVAVEPPFSVYVNVSVGDPLLQ